MYWTSLAPTGTPPSPRFSQAAVFDNVRRSMIVFGGHNGSVPVNDTWVLGLAAATTLTAPAAAGTFGATTDLQATLSAAGVPVSSMQVAFSLFGAPVGSATTDSNGVATLTNVSIAGHPSASYSGVVAATFAATPTYLGSNATANYKEAKRAAAVRSICLLGGIVIGTRSCSLTEALHS